MADNDAAVSPYNQLAERIYTWSFNNFGDQPPENPFFGISEEVLLEFQTAYHNDDKKDALADALIFLCDHIGRMGWNLEQCLASGRRMATVERKLGHAALVLEIAKDLGRASQAILKSRQGIRMQRAGVDYYEEQHRGSIGHIWLLIDFYCLDHFNANAYHLVNDVFTNVVAKRDWKKNPENGVTA